MESFKHVSNTWLVAQMINPLVFYGFTSIVWQDWADIYFIPLLLFFSFLFSLGGYVFCILSFNLLWRLKFSDYKLFLVWIVTMSICIVMGIYFTCLILLDFRTFFEIRLLVIPGIVSAIMAACIRFKYFISTINFLREDYYSNNNHTT
jgi:hypothetical protein